MDIFAIGLGLLAVITTVALFRISWANAFCELRARKADAWRRARDFNSAISEPATEELDEIHHQDRRLRNTALGWKLGLFVIALVSTAVIIKGMGS